MSGTTGGCNDDYAEALKLVASKQADVRPVISHVLPMSKLGEAYDVAMSGPCSKIVIKGE